MEKQAQTIEVYSSPKCHYCHEAKDFLTKKGFDFFDFNVLEDSDKREEMIEISGQMSIPVIVVKEEGKNTKVLTGFDEVALIIALGL